MPHRAVLVIALASLALLAIAVAPWRLSSTGLPTVVAQQLRSHYGVGLDVRGRSTIAFLPVPRVKLEDITVTGADGQPVISSGTLRGELSLLNLLFGQVVLSELTLNSATVEVRLDENGVGAWQQILASIRRYIAGQGSSVSHIRRLVLTNSSVRLRNGSADEATISDVNMVANWPGIEGVAELAGSATFAGERIQVSQLNIRPAELLAGAATPFRVAAILGPAGLSASGDLQIGEYPRMSGRSLIELRSARDFSRWSGVGVPLGSFLYGLSIEGDFVADRRKLSWPSARVTLGADQLDGTVGIHFDSSRMVVTGTLAAERLDLSGFFQAFMQARTPSGFWSGEPLSLSGATSGDLDLRLSATSARLGRLDLGDVAANILVRPGRVEASLGRASLNGGVVKARMALSALSDGVDLKVQGSFDRVNLAPLLADLNQARWIAGQAHGQLTLEGMGQSPVDLVRHAHGRANIVVRQGELIGIGLNDALKRVEKRPLSASLEWRGGRTPFELAQVSVNVGGGIGEIVEGSLTAPSLRTALSGRVSLLDRALAVKAQVDAIALSPGSGPSITFDVTGGWDDVLIVPDAKQLIQRSGAAKPLFGPAPSGAASRGAAAEASP